MNSNKTEDYSMGFNIRGNDIYLDIKDESLNISNGENTEFEIDYVKENYINVNVPQNLDLKEVANHPMWEDYNGRCIACARCIL